MSSRARPDPVADGDRARRVARIMDSFATRTGIAPGAAPRRYLWTDAFAVCNYLALHARTGAPHWLEHARRLVDQVHRVLGRHRPDDARTGWISGLDERTGARHPTAGGLRIGKRLPERGEREPADAGTDWDRDGQYHHYLTRWMHALRRAAAETDDDELLRDGVELAKAAHAAFAHRQAGATRLYWKMSIDLSRPIVTSTGQHDALDGLVTAAALHAAASPLGEAAPTLEPEISELAAMCRGRGWTSGDTLGIGGLLTDAWFLSQLPDRIPGADALLARLLHDAARSLDVLAAGGYVEGDARDRLPFRELGLSLGLAAVERLDAQRSAGRLAGGGTAAAAVQALVRHFPLRRRIESFWEQPPHQQVDTWLEHEDINAVMLGTSLLPEGYLGTR